MSPTPAPPAPARLAGFVLIGLAVIAVGLGVFALVSSGSTGSAAPPPASASATTAPASHPTTTPATTAPTTTTTVAPATSSSPTPVTPATTIVPPPPVAPPANVAAPVPVQVYNNGTIKGLADRAAAEFRGAGFDVVEVGNYAQTVLPHTTAYYTSPAEQQVANQLAQRYGMRTAPRFPLIGTYPPGVIVILTNDFN